MTCTDDIFGKHKVLVQQLARTDTYQDATVARALIRLLGKIAAGERDGRTLLHLIDSAGLDADTRILRQLPP